MIGLRAGRLRHCLTIQRKDDAQDSYGDYIETWTTKGEVYGGVEPIRGDEVLKAGRLDDRTRFKIIIRFFDNLLYTDRILFGQRVFHIKEILNIEERNHQMELICVEDKAVTFGLLKEDNQLLLKEDGDKILLE